MREVFALATLSPGCAHVVRYHHSFAELDRVHVVMELCERSLERRAGEGPLAPPLAFTVARHVLLALEHCHAHGIAHLDVKPSNIFVAGGLYKLGDFGLAVPLEGDDDITEGDVRYMSRELLSDGRRDLSKADIFSLGATVYELSRGRPLPTSGEEWVSLREGVVAPNPNAPADLAALYTTCMRVAPETRPSAAQLLRSEPNLQPEAEQALAVALCRIAKLERRLAGTPADAPADAVAAAPTPADPAQERS
jgi:wee1-like protein kinase